MRLLTKSHYTRNQYRHYLSDAYYGQRIAAAHIQRIPIQRPEERISIWLRDSIGVKYVISYVKSFDSSSNAYGAHVNGISPTYCSAAFSTSKWLILRTKSKDEKGHCLVDETIVHVIKREFCPEFNYRINNVLLSLPLSWIICACLQTIWISPETVPHTVRLRSQ